MTTEETNLKGLPVHGYRDQPRTSVAAVNYNKTLEAHLLDHLDELLRDDDLDVDPRWTSIARTHFEQGFMALNRAVFKPAPLTLTLKEDNRENDT